MTHYRDMHELLALIALDELELDDDEAGAFPLDGIAIVRIQRADWDRPRIGYTSSGTLPREHVVGLLTIVLDRERAIMVDGWERDSDDE
jgi:hypothetical protein